MRFATGIYFAGCLIYTAVQAASGYMAGHRGLTWLFECAMQALYSIWWPLLLSYGFPHIDAWSSRVS